MEKFILRSQLQVDASPKLKQILKQIAANENKTLREVVLLAIADKYPQTASYVKAELRKYQDG
jgi:hypothetical protein